MVAMSSGWPTRPTGISAARSRIALPDWAVTLCSRGVSISPGQMVCGRIQVEAITATRAGCGQVLTYAGHAGLRRDLGLSPGHQHPRVHGARAGGRGGGSGSSSGLDERGRLAQVAVIFVVILATVRLSAWVSTWVRHAI